MRYFIFAVALTFCGSVASAIDMPDLAKKRNCPRCHAIDKKIVGPSWLDVAKRYKRNEEAPLFLANKIWQGGFGVWGPVPMPEQHVSNEEAKKLAKFILELPIDRPIDVSRR